MKCVEKCASLKLCPQLQHRVMSSSLSVVLTGATPMSEKAATIAPVDSSEREISRLHRWCSGGFTGRAGVSQSVGAGDT